MPKFIQIIGPQAVGKMTVGQELAKITGYKLLYNHMTIEMVRSIFDYDKEAFLRINSIITYENLQKAIKKELYLQVVLTLEMILKKKRKKQISGWTYLKKHILLN